MGCCSLEDRGSVVLSDLCSSRGYHVVSVVGGWRFGL